MKKQVFAVFCVFMILGSIYAEEGSGEDSDEGFAGPQKQVVDLELSVPNQSFRKSIVVNLNDDEVVTFGASKLLLKKKKKLKKLKKLLVL